MISLLFTAATDGASGQYGLGPDILLALVVGGLLLLVTIGALLRYAITRPAPWEAPKSER